MSEEKSRRTFMKTATAGAAGLVIGSMVGMDKAMAASDIWRPSSTPITEMLGDTYSALLTERAKDLTKAHLLEIMKMQNGSQADFSGISDLNTMDLNSIHSAFQHKIVADHSTSGTTTMDGASCCCCCCPACCC